VPAGCPQVLFLEVAPGEGRDALQRVADAALARFRAAGLAHEDGKPFAPHITVAKTSRLIGHKRHKGAARGARGIWGARSEAEQGGRTFSVPAACCCTPPSQAITTTATAAASQSCPG
jgi:hypothetical protein